MDGGAAAAGWPEGVAAGVEIGGVERAVDLPGRPRLLSPAPGFGRLDLPDGGWIRHAAWPPPEGTGERGTAVLVQGRSEFIEKYDAVAHRLRARGWRVLAFDVRGQGLSSRFLPDRRKGHAPDFAVLEADLALYLDRVAAAARGPGPLVLVGHSMGGHIVQRLLGSRPGAADAAVLSAPMADIWLGGMPRRLARWAARAAVALGRGAEWGPGQRPYDAARHAFATNPVTSDRAGWAVQHLWYREAPDLALGGVTFGWLDAAFRSMDPLARPGAGAHVRLPFLVLAAGRDGVVPVAAQAALARVYPNCRVELLEESMHEPLMERAEVRERAWAAVEGFLAGVG